MKKIESVNRVRLTQQVITPVTENAGGRSPAYHNTDEIDYDEVSLCERVSSKIDVNDAGDTSIMSGVDGEDMAQLSRAVLGGEKE